MKERTIIALLGIILVLLGIAGIIYGDPEFMFRILWYLILVGGAVGVAVATLGERLKVFL